MSSSTPQRVEALQTETTEIGRYTLRYTIEWITPRRADVRAHVVIPASAERIWGVLTAYERLADFIPDMTLSQIIRRKEAGMLLHQQGLIWFPFYRREVEVLLEINEDHGRSISFRLVEDVGNLEEPKRIRHDFLFYEGSWALQKVGQETEISYEVIVEPNFWMPDWVLSELQRRTLKKTFRAIIQRCLT